MPHPLLKDTRDWRYEGLDICRQGVTLWKADVFAPYRRSDFLPSQELDRLNSVSADESAEDLRRGYSGRLSDAGCSEEADKLKILTEVKRSGHETLGQSQA